MKIYHGTRIDHPSQGESLSKIGHTNRLLSYYYVKELYKPHRLRRVRCLRRLHGLVEDELTEYLTTGSVTQPSTLTKTIHND